MDRKQTDPFVCMYVSQYNVAAFKTLLGARLFVAMDADVVANTFFASLAQDIVERYNDTDKNNLRQGLEACLFLTDSKCKVPDPLQKELDATQLNYPRLEAEGFKCCRLEIDCRRRPVRPPARQYRRGSSRR